MVADALSCFGFEGEHREAAHSAVYDVSDVSLWGQLVDWLRCIAPHVDLDMCVMAAQSGLAASRTLSSLSCKKCHAVHLDADDFATRPHRYHRCGKCDHQWAVSPMV